MNAARAGLLILCALISGCAGWSSWEDGQQPSSRQAGPGEYKVRRGDTMYSIAFRNGVDFRELARWNGIGSDYLIYPGQILRLSPGRGAPSTPRATTKPGTGTTGPVVATIPPTQTSPVPPAGANRSTSVSAAKPSPPMAAGEWQWPTQAAVIRKFGEQNSKGLDFGGKEGQPVFAAAGGRVVYSGNALKGYGELIIIKHDDEFLSAYGYNQSRAVGEGDIVTAGQPIGRMGRGPENKPLLHFEIRRSGRPVDPTTYLPKSPS